MMQKEEPTLPFDVTSCRRTAVEASMVESSKHADVFKKHGNSLPSISTVNHLTINVQGVPRRKKQESRLKLKRKKVK